MKLAMSRRRLFIAVLIVLGVSGYFAWKHFTKPTGAQRVAFVPAIARSFKTSDGKLQYTVYEAKAGVSGDVIYHLHGRNLDHTIWNDDTYFTAQLQQWWQQHSIKPPVVVEVSYGPVWLLTPRNSKEASGLLDDFMSQLPEIEAKIQKPTRRILLGESMGGLNVLIAGLTHPTAFTKVAALCPGVYLHSPFFDLSTLREGLKRTGADPKVIYGIKKLATTYVSNDKEWKAISPIELVERANSAYPRLYLSNGLYDKYGNFEGTEALAKRAAAKGVKTEWHPLYGGHCAIDVASLADFLVNMEVS